MGWSCWCLQQQLGEFPMNEIYLLAAHRCQCVMVSCYFVLFHPLLALMTALE